MDNTLSDVVEFMERIEPTDDFDATSEEVKAKKSSSNKKKDRTPKKENSNYGKKCCLLHGKGSHTTDESNALQKEAKRLKSNHSGSDK